MFFLICLSTFIQALHRRRETENTHLLFVLCSLVHCICEDEQMYESLFVLIRAWYQGMCSFVHGTGDDKQKRANSGEVDKGTPAETTYLKPSEWLKHRSIQPVLDPYRCVFIYVMLVRLNG